MSNSKFNKSELFNGRLSVLFFWSLLMAALLWAEREIWGRRPSLIFREMLPWLMPIVFGVFAIVLILLAIFWKKGKTRTDKFFSVPFLVYLTAAPFLAAFLPWSAIFFPADQLFGYILDVLFIGLIGYFIGYIFFATISRAAGLLAGYSTLCAAILAGYHQIYINSGNAFLSIDYYPNEKLAAFAIAVILLAVAFALLIGASKKKLSLKKPAILIPFGVTALIMLTSAFFRSQIPIAAREWLALGGIAALALWLIGRTVYDKMTNKK